ncbi:LLM class oxidoreductase [Paenibacillus sp. Root444D2]|uniref:LLM class oxidoreductase n=1 Tax=Paenibacillus sp. Root444D2 TaxID=1736538 RepID=UPI0007108999|nr:LLM class oxidoreductase [Paenibacillus sp. Root444D2]KQX55277.1 5,10-methylene tetrahydromethanopterin reductase [Paenibacillus sp. Root444D2]
MNPFDNHKGYNRIYKEGELTLGLFVPIENFRTQTPTMENQVELAQKAENYGFSALWFRDVLLEDPSFGDPAVGQIFDMMVYLTYIATQTKKIGLGTAAAVLPLRHPLRVAKEIASIDRLFTDRLIFGVSSGDRGSDFMGLNISDVGRGEAFVEAFHFIKRVLYEEYPPDLLFGSNLVPKPTKRIPTLITGQSQQSLEWNAEHGDGWIYYPRSPFEQKNSINVWRELVEIHQPGVFKPFTQPMYLDLAEDPNEPPRPITKGYRIGSKHLVELLNLYKTVGVNHLMFFLYYGQRPANEVVQELGEEVLPDFPPHE